MAIQIQLMNILLTFCVFVWPSLMNSPVIEQVDVLVWSKSDGDTHIQRYQNCHYNKYYNHKVWLRQTVK